MEEDGDDLAALVEALDRAPAHVDTNSYGGNVALRLALSRPELFRSPTCHEPPLWSLLGDDPENAAMREQGARMLRAVAQRLASGDHDCAGTWHRWWNAGDGEVQERVRIEPSMRFQEAILVVWGLCADGHTNAEGRPSPLSARCSRPATARSSASGSRPTPCRRSCSRGLPPSLGDGDSSARSIDRYLDLETHPAAQAGLGRLPERVMTRAPHAVE